jgi:hypothetical protein
MPRQDLVATFVGDHRFEGEILRIGISLKCFRIDREQISLWRTASAILGTTRLAVNVPVLDAANKSELVGDAGYSAAA